MTVLFYLDPCRDEDFWPIARSVVAAGHSVYYAIATHAPVDAIIAADRRLAFDLVVSGDRVWRMANGAALNTILVKRPPLLEVVVNDLLEIVMESGVGDGSFANLARDGVSVAVLDPQLCETARRAGVPRVVFLPFGVFSHQITDPSFFVRRGGKRVFGEIRPDDLTTFHPIDWFRARREHASEGYVGGARPGDVVFLGECRLGPDRGFLSYVAETFLAPVSGETLLASDECIRRRLGIEAHATPTGTSADIAPALLCHVPVNARGRLQEIGFLLLREHYEEQIRIARRLALVRCLVAEFGPRFELYGDHFVHLGLPARPTDHSFNERKYLRSKIAMDFGSNAYDCSLDPRPSRIIACGSLLLQFRRPDAAGWYGDLEARMTFEDADGMIAGLDRYLSSPDEAAATVHAQQTLSSKKCGMDAIVREFLARRPWSLVSA